MPLASPWWMVAAPAAAALVAATMGVLVLRARPGEALNRRLAVVLASETAVVALVAVISALYGQAAQPPIWGFLAFVAFCSLAPAYLDFIALLRTPTVAWLRGRAARLVLLASVPAFAVAAAAFGTPDSNQSSTAVAVMSGLSILYIILASILAIVASVSAARRTRPGTPLREQAIAFAAAFITRDALWIASTSLGFYVWSAGNATATTLVWSLGPAIVAFAYVPILAYGILKAQLFDIDLKIKVGIRRGTVATIAIVGVLAAAKVAEFYLSKEVGFIAAGVTAGLTLFLAPRLNKLGDKVASTALPRVQDTDAYLQFRKLEVYKAALESALEGGEVTEKERGSLDRLRGKLGIAAADAVRVEADVRDRGLAA